MVIWDNQRMRFIDEPSEVENKQKSFSTHLYMITKEDLQDVWDRTYSSLTEYIERVKKNYPNKPSKPLLKQGHSLDEAKVYVELLQSYEKDLLNYKQEKEEVEEYNSQLDSLLEDYLMELSGYSSLSEEQQKLVTNFYWDNFSKNTLAEKYNTIESIVDFVKQIKNS